jgi:hypothetical protein
MIEFICDTCHKRRKEDGNWILGLAAETRGAQSSRREVNILSRWSEPEAVHPLAVHFCSDRCKERYMKRLFTYDLAS